jgi:NAD(P)-dependent dehydrogenase (short-subunit alcohol dehydrogenase family)
MNVADEAAVERGVVDEAAVERGVADAAAKYGRIDVLAAMPGSRSSSRSWIYRSPTGSGLVPAGQSGGATSSAARGVAGGRL